MRFLLGRRALWLCLLTAIAASSPSFARADATTSFARFATPLGNVDVKLFPQQAPKNVANFLSYVDQGLYNNTFIERSVPGFVLQGGGYDVNLGQPSPISPITRAAAVQGEPGVSNTRGTLAMALPQKSDGSTNADGGTDEWFFNLADNLGLDQQKFTVFGQVVDARSMAVLDKIAALATTTFSSVAGGAFPTPILNGTSADPAQLVTTQISRLSDTAAPTITISSPSEHAQIPEGASVVPQFSCDDGTGVGVASCQVTQPLDTSMVGLDQFTVTATDHAGNTSTKTVDFTVLAPVVPPKPVVASALPAVKLGTATVSGSVPVTIRCPAGARGGCAGIVALTARSGKRTVSLGTVRYKVAAGKRGVLALRLNHTALALLRKNHLRLPVTLSVTPTGAKVHTSTPRLVQRAKR